MNQEEYLTLLLFKQEEMLYEMSELAGRADTYEYLADQYATTIARLCTEIVDLEAKIKSLPKWVRKFYNL